MGVWPVQLPWALCLLSLMLLMLPGNLMKFFFSPTRAAHFHFALDPTNFIVGHANESECP